MIYSSSKDSALFIVPLWLLTTVKRGATLQTRYVTGVPFVNRRYTIGAPFLSKMVHVYERGKGLDLEVSPHRTFLSSPSKLVGGLYFFKVSF